MEGYRHISSIIEERMGNIEARIDSGKKVSVHEQRMAGMDKEQFISFLRNNGIHNKSHNIWDEYSNAKQVVTDGEYFTDSKLYDKLIRWTAEWLKVA